MAFNVFGPPTKEDITVGYISTERGFVSGLTVCDANSYAKANPGSVFIFQTRKETKYLNINEVNKLTPADLESEVKTCGGIQLDAECGGPEVIFMGGGGVGAKANPIIGTDGAVLGVDLVSGGFGYRYPPKVQVKDPCGIGAGPVTEAFLGNLIDTVETYEEEEDFEEYEICDDNAVGFGSQYGPNGEVIGNWDPRMYTNFSTNPFDKEVSDYQKSLREFKNPWWTSRQLPPNKVTSDGKTTRSKYDVDFPAWNDFMNQYAISPVPKSNVVGSDFAGKPFSLEWNVDVPYDGEYIIRGLCDNKATMYWNNTKVADLKGFQSNPEPIKKVLKASPSGETNKLRLDILNYATKEKVSRQNFTLSGGSVLEVEDWDDYDWTDLKCFVNEGTFTNVSGTRCKFKVDPTDNFPAGTYKEIDVRITTGTMFINNIEIAGLFSVSGPERDASGNNKQLNKRFKQLVEVGKTYDVIVKNIAGNTVGLTPKRLLIRTKTLPARALPTPTSTESDTLKKNIFNTVDYIDKATRPLWRTNVYGRGGFLNDNGVCPFDTMVQLEDNPYPGDHRIVWNNVEFPFDGHYLIEIAVDDNVSFYIGDLADPQVNIRKEGFTDKLPNGWPDNADGENKATGTLRESHYVKKGRHTITADLNQIAGGKFGFSNIKGINPMALAINIKTAYSEEEVDVKKSWNENPLGVALTIEAPLPTIPQQPLPQQEGRCPPNPIWSTRFPNADVKWHPVQFKGWHKYLNKYAMSPIPPLTTPNSDGGGGFPYRNKWNVNIPHTGFYKLKAAVDDIARIYVDGELKLDLNPSNPKGERRRGEKLFKLIEGTHEIEVEVENYRFEKFKLIDQEVFSTADWTTDAYTTLSTVTSTAMESGSTPIQFNGLKEEGDRRKAGDRRLEFDDDSEQGTSFDVNGTFTIDNGNAKFSDDGRSIEGDGEVTLTYTWNDIPGYKSKALENITILSDDGSPEGKEVIWTQLNVRRGSETHTIKLKGKAVTSTDKKKVNLTGVKAGTKKDGVVYDGPNLATYTSGSLGPQLTPAWKDQFDYRANFMGKSWIMKWKGVNFPSSGKYTIKLLADDNIKVKVGGIQVAEASVFQNVRSYNFDTGAGKKDIEMELTNIPGNATSTFRSNPTVFAVKITTAANVGTGETKPWSINPIGISASLIPPPCPKKIEGRGVVTDVKVLDPGNGFSPPVGPAYPVLLRLKNVIVEDPGINYDCAIDTVIIEEGTGAKLRICGCDSFGRISKICVDDGGQFTEYPDLRISSATGIGAALRPQFEIIRDPLPAPDRLIQVTDLVGVKQTGYYDGRPYYGAVFYKEGLKYAGYYETVGELIPIYDTLQESIDAEVTTPPSAIQRQGTDISSNDPRLNIPGTPENLTDN